MLSTYLEGAVLAVAQRTADEVRVGRLRARMETGACKVENRGNTVRFD